MSTDDRRRRVEDVCAALLATGQPVTFYSPEADGRLTASLDWRRTEGEEWTITVETSDGTSVRLEDGPEMFKTFRDKEDGCIKVVMKP